METAQTLTRVVPERDYGWVHLSLAFNALHRFREAYDVLLPVLDRFPKQPIMRYNMACYACKLGDLNDARDWLKETLQIGDVKQFKLIALEDPDLEPLWPEIREV